MSLDWLPAKPLLDFYIVGLIVYLPVTLVACVCVRYVPHRLLALAIGMAVLLAAGYAVTALEAAVSNTFGWSGPTWHALLYSWPVPIAAFALVVTRTRRK